MKQVRQKEKTRLYSHLLLVLFYISLSYLSGCAHGNNTQVNSDSHPVADTTEAEDDDDFFDDEESFEINDIAKEERLVADPLYYFNKAMYHFNDKLYFWLLKPSAKAYKKVTPGFFRSGVKNFFNNLGMPLRFTSSLLQGKGKSACSEVGRFVVNTTLGFGGLIDTATHGFKIKEADEDLGQVLGSYGIGNGFYLYLPFIGPTTLRDAVGTAGGSYLNPLKYMENKETGLILFGYSSFNSLSFSLGNYEAVKSASLDPYSMIRDFYIEQRRKKIRE